MGSCRREYGGKSVQKSANKQRISLEVNEMNDEELLSSFLAGDKKLLANYLLKVCYPAFKSLARKFVSLKLEADEVVSIACVHLLEYNMSVLRSYKPEKMNNPKEGGMIPKSGDVCKSRGLRCHIINTTKQCLGDMLGKKKKEVGTGEGKKWVIEHPKQDSQQPDDITKSSKIQFKLENGISLSLDDPEILDNSRNISALLDNIGMPAMDFNTYMAELPIQQQHVMRLIYAHDKAPREVGEILGLSANDVYKMHQEAKLTIKKLYKKWS